MCKWNPEHNEMTHLSRLPALTKDDACSAACALPRSTFAFSMYVYSFFFQLEVADVQLAL